MSNYLPLHAAFASTPCFLRAVQQKQRQQGLPSTAPQYDYSERRQPASFAPSAEPTYPTPSSYSTPTLVADNSSPMQMSFSYSTPPVPQNSYSLTAQLPAPPTGQLLHQHTTLTSLLVLLIWSHQCLPKLLPPLSKFREQITPLLHSTQISSPIVVLALYYLSRLALCRSKLPEGSILLQDDSARLALLVCLVLANKYADDERFTNAAWAGVAGVPTASLNQAEFDTLHAFNYRLEVGELEWSRWVEKLSSFVETAERKEMELAAKRADMEKLKAMEYMTEQFTEKKMRSYIYIPSPVTPTSVNGQSSLVSSFAPRQNLYLPRSASFMTEGGRWGTPMVMGH
ncbi:hypothetical protein BC832DRAFT_595930 [Gaertneriomyces semiglobifer]|nr:hypothetical protein BC832DRAFT_595930 [Gaertneriomyces semiglobifer]